MRDWRWRSLLFAIFFIFIIYYYFGAWWKYDRSWLDLIIMMIVKSWSILDLMIIWNRTIGIRKKTNVGALAVTDSGRRRSHMTARRRYLESRFCWLYCFEWAATWQYLEYLITQTLPKLWICGLFLKMISFFLILFYIWNSVSKYLLYPPISLKVSIQEL